MDNKEKKKVFFSNLLGPERIKQLLAKNDPTNLDGSNIVITELERELSLCSHHYDNISYLLMGNDDEDDGRFECRICGDKFHLIQDANGEDLKLAVENILDILNSIKFTWIEINEESAREFFSIIATIRKIPEMYKAAIDSINFHYSPAKPEPQHKAQAFSGQNFQYEYQPFTLPYHTGQFGNDPSYNPTSWDQFSTIMDTPLNGGTKTLAPVKVVKAKRTYTKKNKSPITE